MQTGANRRMCIDFCVFLFNLTVFHHGGRRKEMFRFFLSKYGEGGNPLRLLVLRSLFERQVMCTSSSLLTGKSKLTVGDNVKLLSWLPQNDILGHPKTRLFIGHAGINGIMESVYHAVPMICSPFFGDQFYNAQILKQAGIGEMIDLESTTSEQLFGLIRKMLSDPR